MTKKNKNIPFEISHKGKCCSCEENKQLDTMVRKDGKKGLYECIDCKVDTEAQIFNNYENIMSIADYDKITLKGKTFKKLIRWAVG